MYVHRHILYPYQNVSWWLGEVNLQDRYHSSIQIVSLGSLYTTTIAVATTITITTTTTTTTTKIAATTTIARMEAITPTIQQQKQQ